MVKLDLTLIIHECKTELKLGQIHKCRTVYCVIICSSTDDYFLLTEMLII